MTTLLNRQRTDGNTDLAGSSGDAWNSFICVPIPKSAISTMFCIGTDGVHSRQMSVATSEIAIGKQS